MKMQDLAIIFIIIIIPISIVLSIYTQFQIKTVNTQTLYDTKLTSATFDAIKAFQLNTANSTLDALSDSKIRDIEASVNTFKNSMMSTFKLNGYTQEDLNNYIPALVYTMYDGFYIYSPYKNNNYMEDENDKTTIYGLKPYIPYSCRYQRDNIDVVITYTLDNYITIQGMVGSEYINKSGYLIDNIDEENENVTYNEVKIEEENLKEYVIGQDGMLNEYQYVTYNGTKYYYDESKDLIFYYSNGVYTVYAKDDETNKEFNKILKKMNDEQTENKENPNNEIYGEEYPYVNYEGIKRYYDKTAYSFFWYKNGNRFEYRGNKAYNEMKEAITNNNSAVRYYKNAKEFTDYVEEYLGGLTFADAIETTRDEAGNSDTKQIWENDGRKIFEEGNIENKTSNFNQHRLEVIRRIIETNLSIAISNYASYSGINGIVFQMPELSEEEWDLVLNNISLISFVQGLDIGGKIYNGYTIVNNTESKEVVQEDRIYILGKDNYYHKIGDTYLNNDSNIVDVSAGRLNIDFKRKTAYVNNNNLYYYSVKYDGKNSYKASYNSVITQNGVEDFDDIYEYIYQKNGDKYKKAFYTALGREREGTYKYSTTNIQ